MFVGNVWDRVSRVEMFGSMILSYGLFKKYQSHLRLLTFDCVEGDSVLRLIRSISLYKQGFMFVIGIEVVLAGIAVCEHCRSFTPWNKAVFDVLIRLRSYPERPEGPNTV